MSESVGTEGGQDGGMSDFVQGIGQELGISREEARQAREEARESKEMFKKLEGVFKEQPKDNPQAWFDNILDAVMEADRQGKPMPITGQMATILAKVQEQTLGQQAQIEKLEKIIQQLSNPANAANQRAYMAMDDAITTTLEGIYGEVPMAFHNAVSSEVESILRTLQTEAPAKWEQIRRSETYQKRLVAHCAQKLVPPKAREIVMEKHEKERPTTYADIMQARSEIREMKRAVAQGHDVGYTPKQLESFERQVREQEWEMRYNGPRKYNQGRRA
jgi:hypothetical protein